MNLCAVLRPIYLIFVLPILLALQFMVSPRDSSDSALRLSIILSVPKFLLSHWPGSW